MKENLMMRKNEMFKKWAALGVFLMLLFICVNGFSVTTLQAQSSAGRISLSLRQASMTDIIKAIQKESSYHFLYQTDELKSYSKKDFRVTNASLNEVLDELISGTNLTYRIEKDMILIKASRQQTKPKYKVIFGQVVDESGSPLPGVSVKIVGHPGGAQTDARGHFAVNVGTPSGKIVLRFSYVGMISQNAEYRGRDLRIVMHEDSNVMDEVVVTGYQTMSKRESASAISSVKAADIMVTGLGSIDQMLQGTIPGLAVMNTSGEPSATPKIRIRGNATINGNKSPVWVVDGVIVEQDVPFTASDINSDDAQYLVGSAISGVNPQDIETITVLKDASATAIYGVKAANGVIVVTTKKGRSGRPYLTYNGGLTLNTRPSYDNYELMNSKERVEFSKMMVDNGYTFGRTPYGETYEAAYEQLLNKNITLGEFKDKVNTLQSRNTDWFGALFRNNVTNTHSIDISGGSDRVKYYMSAGYSDIEGSARTSNSRKFTTLAKVTADINKHINFMAKIGYTNTSNRGYDASINPFHYAYNQSRTIPVYNDDGSYYMTYTSAGTLGTNNLGYNVLKELEETGQSSKMNDFYSLLQLNVKFTDYLKYEGTFSWNNSTTDTRDWATEQSNYVSKIRGYEYGAYTAYDKAYWDSNLPYGGILSQGSTTHMGYTIRNQVNFNKMFGDVHSVNLIAGIEARRNAYKGHSVTGYGWSPDFGEVFNPVMTTGFKSSYLESGSTLPSNTNSFTQVASYYGIASYAYADRYIFNFNIRSDGSNKFGSDPKYRWLPTYSFALKWNLVNEPFMKKYKSWVDDLAFRGSYGIQGNINVDNSPYLIVTTGGRDAVLGLPISYIRRLPNPDLRWEKTYSWDAAIDFSFLKGRIRGGLDLYGKRTKDLIMTMEVASSNGTGSLYYNAGKMTNKGYEGFINVGLYKDKDWDWRFGVNFSHNINKITYANPEKLSDYNVINQMLSGSLAVKGAPIGSLYSFRYAGLNQDNGYPMSYTKDGKKVIEGNWLNMELVRSGSIFPKLTGGFDTEIRYQQLSLGLNFTYSFGSVARLPNYYESGSYIDPLTNLSTDWLKCWKKSGDDTVYPVPYNYEALNNYFATETGAQYYGYDKNVSGARHIYPYTLYNYSDIRVAKADFLKLKMVSLSYRFKSEWLQTLHLSNLMLRAQVTNLFTIANKKWNGLDPETRTGIPMVRTYSMSVNVSF
jgi:TonB-linked SusC/RagA family outer membrane protein